MPLVQAARNTREWLKTVAVLTVSIVLVTALWGAIVGVPATALAGIVGSRRTMGQIEQVVLLVTGLVMLVVALSELGLIRRLLPDVRLGDSSTHAPSSPTSGNRYRRVAVVGATAAATFGVTCNKPLYVLLLTYVALVGGMGFGALALGAYGLGLASSIALGGFALLPARRSERLARWLGARQQTFHLVQGVVFAFMGGMTVAFFWLRYVPPPA